MNRVYINYSENTFDELSKIIKKLNWKVFNNDGTEFDGKLTEGSYKSVELSDKSKSKINDEIPINLIIKYDFTISKNKYKPQLFFTYNITEIKTIVDNEEIKNNIELIKIKELIDEKFYSKSNLILPEILRRNRRKKSDGRNPASVQEKRFERDYDSDTSFEFMILLKLMKRMDRRLDDIEKNLKTSSSKKTNDEKGDIDDKILSVIEVAELLGLAKATIYTKVNRKELPHMKRGKNLYFSEKEINEYLKGGKILSNEEIDEISKKYISNSPNKRINQ
jgi:excisionase family DNA binding protein